MSSDAAAQLRRLLVVLPQLADGKRHTYEEVSSRAGAAWSTIFGDLGELSERGDDPGGFVEGVQIYMDARHVQMISSHFHRPMRLTPRELMALELGLAVLRAERPPEEHAALERARDRLRHALAGAVQDGSHAHAVPAHRADPAHLAVLQRCMRERCKVDLTYHGAAAEEESSRVAYPYGLIVASGMWYLVAYCERSGAVRIFRLDRVTHASAGKGTFPFPEGFSVQEVVRGGRVLSVTDAGRSMKVRYSPAIARWIAEREEHTREPGGSIVVEHPVADEEWAIRHVLQYGAEAEVIEPRDLRATISERLREIAITAT